MYAFLALVVLCLLSRATATPLDDYVWKPDDNYKWENLGETIEGRSVDGLHRWTGYMLNVTSQQWLTPEDVDLSVWWHVLVVIVPENVDFSRNATMWVTGGSNSPGLPSATDEDILLSAALAMGTGTITGALFQIPNEKVIFSGDPEQMSRGEDAIIAYTWDHFLKDPDSPEWLVRLPMVKAVLRGMDAMTEFVALEFPEEKWALDYYVVAGASKRGWTTWLMGAVDPTRVMAIVPIVLDAVNFVKVEHHQFQSYGGWSYALEDYYHMNITARFDSPNMEKLSEIEDPYYYFDRLTMPKLVVNAVGDEFQQPDDTHFWWKDLPQPKHFLMIPNAEHSLATGIFEATPAIGSWILTLLQVKPVPTMDWHIDNSGSGDITLRLGDNTDEEVLRVRKFWATTCASSPRRDFRFLNIDEPCECGYSADGYCLNTQVTWQSELLRPVVPGGRTYVAKHEAPTDGTWAAFFIDVQYKQSFMLGSNWAPGFIPKDRKGQMEFTTEVSVVPQTYPYEDCRGLSCYGTLT
jgi:PhoPQ-activated pathogenicity-related protein